MSNSYPEKVEITPASECGAPLLKITDNTLEYRFYYRNDNGILILGQPSTYLIDGHRVFIFTPLGNWTIPIVLKVDHL